MDIRNINIVVPRKVSEVTSYDLDRRTGYKTKYNMIVSKYGSTIKEVSDLTGIPEKLIVAFIILRSGGDANLNVDGYKGLFALSDQQAKAIITKEVWLNRLSSREESILDTAIGNVTYIDGLVKAKKSVELNDSVIESPSAFNATKTEIRKDILFNPTFSILVGSIFLSQLFDTYDGDLSRVIVKLASKPFGKNVKLLRGKYDFFNTEDFNRLDRDEVGLLKQKAGTNILDMISPNGILDSIMNQ